jgi:hypothetical protein
MILLIKSMKEEKIMNDYEKLEWLVFAIQEAINGNNGELENALEIIEILREPFLKGDTK